MVAGPEDEFEGDFIREVCCEEVQVAHDFAAVGNGVVLNDGGRQGRVFNLQLSFAQVALGLALLF